MISTGEAATLIYAAAFGIASACFLLSLAVLWFVWRRFEDRVTAKVIEFEKQIAELQSANKIQVADFERQIRQLQEQNRKQTERADALTDMLIILHPDAMSSPLSVTAGRDVITGADIVGRDKKPGD